MYATIQCDFYFSNKTNSVKKIVIHQKLAVFTETQTLNINMSNVSLRNRILIIIVLSINYLHSALFSYYCIYHI